MWRFLLPLIFITGPLFAQAQADHPFLDIPEQLVQVGATHPLQMVLADPQMPNTMKWDFNQEGDTLTMLGQCVSRDGTPFIIVQTINILNVSVSAKNLGAALKKEMMAANGGVETCDLIFKRIKGKSWAISSKSQFGNTTDKTVSLSETTYTCIGEANSSAMVNILARMREFRDWVKARNAKLSSANP